MTRRTCSRCGGRGLVETFGELEECGSCEGTGEPRATVELDDLFGKPVTVLSGPPSAGRISLAESLLAARKMKEPAGPAASGGKGIRLVHEASELGDRFHGVDRARLVRFLERGE